MYQTLLSHSDPSRRVYLAAPYSYKTESVRKWRASMAGKVAMDLILNGHIVYSPVSHGHALTSWPEELCRNCNRIPKDFSFWQAHCESFLRHWAEILAVLCLRGWEESVGVTAEIAEAKRLGLPVVMLEIDNTCIWRWYELDQD